MATNIDDERQKPDSGAAYALYMSSRELTFQQNPREERKYKQA